MECFKDQGFENEGFRNHRFWNRDLVRNLWFLDEGIERGDFFTFSRRLTPLEVCTEGAVTAEGNLLLTG